MPTSAHFPSRCVRLFGLSVVLLATAGTVQAQCGLACAPEGLHPGHAFSAIGDRAGASLAIDGNVAVVGAPAIASLSLPGAAYVFERADASSPWMAVAVLEPSQAQLQTAQFGGSVAIAGDRIVVGAWGDTVESDDGAAFVYERPPAGWVGTLTQNAVLAPAFPTDPAVSPMRALVGRSVALSSSGDTIYVGAPGWDDGLAFTGRRREGRVLVFPVPMNMGVADWGDPATPVLPSYHLAAREHAGMAPLPAGSFTAVGYSLAVWTDPVLGDRVFAGSSVFGEPGVWVFDEPAAGWGDGAVFDMGTDLPVVDGIQVRVVVPTHFEYRCLLGTDSDANDSFAESIDNLGPDVLAVGATLANGGGAVYMFTEGVTAWPPGTITTEQAETQRISACDAPGQFGRAVALASSGRLYAGALAAAYSYERDDMGTPADPTDDSWGVPRVFRPRLRLPGSTLGDDSFGSTLASGSDQCFVGSPGNDARSGEVYAIGDGCGCLRPANGIVHWWTGDGDFLDLIGTEDGTPVGGASTNFGFIDQIFIQSNSTNSYVDVGASAGNFGTEEFTVEFWLNNFFASGIEWASKFDGVQGWRVSGAVGANVIDFLAQDAVDSVGMSFNPPSGMLFNGDWQHLAVTRRTLTSSTARYSIYLNGLLVAEQDDVRLDVSNGASLRLGRPQANAGGALDEVALYDRALDASEVGDIAHAWRLGKCKVGDFVPPVVMITSPQDGDLLRGLVNFDGDATDTDSGIDFVTWRIDGVEQAHGEAPPYTYLWDTTSFADGPHTLTLEAVDNGGNMASDSITVFVDNTPPVLSIPTPLDMATVMHAFPFQADASDGPPATGSGLVSVVMLANALPPNLVDDSVVFGMPTPSTLRTSRVNPHQIMGSSLLLCVIATDAAGNESTVEAQVTIERGGGRTRGRTDDELPYIDDFTWDAFLTFDPGGGPVLGRFPLPRPVPDPSGREVFELRIPGGPPVRALAHRRLRGEPGVMLAFDRRALLASMAAALSSGDQPRTGMLGVLTVSGQRTAGHRLR